MFVSPETLVLLLIEITVVGSSASNLIQVAPVAGDAWREVNECAKRAASWHCNEKESDGAFHCFNCLLPFASYAMRCERGRTRLEAGRRFCFRSFSTTLLLLSDVRRELVHLH